MPKASEASTSSAAAGKQQGKPYKRPGGGGGGAGGPKSRNRAAAGTGDEQAGQPRRRPPPGNHKQQGRRGNAAAAASAAPGDVGISKIKASLRQTKRLLAKENLAPDVRQEAERRLISLEEDLEARQSSEHDRKNAERYHKVRFFERQKLVRQIKKVKKAMAAGTKDGERDSLDAKLHEKRVLLNYVLNFPTKYKYVALFPSNGESPLTKPEAVDVETEASRRAAKTYERAREVREKVVQAMKRGDLSSEPEVELERRGGDAAAAAGSKRLRFDFDGDGPDDDSDGDVATTSVPKPAKKSKHNSADKKSKSDAKSKSKSKESEPPAAAAAAGVQGDDFFASDDDDDE